ncbi:MAG: FmdB family transcriptional regulator [Promicromonosporaceae bacterium]|nr:FmdB family transcriptional regulator [Promicromonosporaceae bacterium]
MPTYAYRCSACGHEFDVVQAFTEESLTACPKCGGLLRKQFGHVAVTFKGSGFYRTDSRSSSDSGPSKAKKSKASPETAAKTVEATSKVKSETKTNATKPTTSSS